MGGGELLSWRTIRDEREEDGRWGKERKWERAVGKDEKSTSK